MGSESTHSQHNKKTTNQPHEVAYGELTDGSLIHLEAILANQRRWGVILYLILLAFSTDSTAIVGTRTNFLILIGFLIVVQTIFWIFEQKYPKFRLHQFKVIRFIYYLFSSAVVLYIGKGSSSFIVLFPLYLILAGVYVGTFWGYFGSIIAMIQVFLVYILLSWNGVTNYDSSQIITRMIAVFLAGTISTYFWYRYIRYRETVVEIENKLLKIAAELTSTLEFDLVLQQAFKLFGDLAKFKTGLIVADLDKDGDYTVLSSWNYPNEPDFHFSITSDLDESENESLTGSVLKNQKSILVSEIDSYPIRPKYPEISPGQKLRSYLGVPLLFGSELFGAFIITSDKYAAFTEKDRENMERISRWLSIAIKNAVTNKELHDLGRYYQEIIDLSDEGIVAADLKGNIVLHNIAARKMLDYTAEELTLIKAKSLYVGGITEAQRVTSEIEEGSGIVRDLHSEIATKSGKSIPVLLSGSNVKDTNGRINSVGYFRDLRKLPLPAERLQVLLDVSTLGLRYPTSDIEQQVQHIMEIFDKEAEGKYVGIIRLVESKKLRVVAGSRTLDLTELQGFSVSPGEGITGQVLTNRQPVFVRNVKEDSRYSYPHFALSQNLHSGLFLPLQYRDNALGALTVYTIGKEDFPETDRAFYVNFSNQISLALATIELTQAYLRKHALELTTQVAIGSAYSMKTPLTSIRGWTQILQFDNKLKNIIESNDFAEVAANIDLATRDLDRLIDELIRATEELNIQLEPIDLYAVVKEAVQDPKIQKTAAEEEIEIRLEGVPSLIKGDRGLLFEAITNVIQNALDAQPRGGEINIRLQHSINGEMRIVVVDHGPGISRKDFEEVADIFLPFSSTKPSSMRQSYGLSLAYTQKIITAHGGRISARNIPSSGTEIEIVMNPSMPSHLD